MNRDNQAWLAELRSEGVVRDRALDDLRQMLLRGLRRSLAGRSGIDDSFLEDMVQDTLMRILERLDQFRGRSRFATWATSIAIRLAISELRRKRWKDVSLDSVVDETGIVPERAIDRGATPQMQAAQRGILEAMDQVIQTGLTDKQRTALLSELKGMPQDEIARHLNSNRNAVYKLTHDARKRLKRQLESAGYGVEDIQAAFGN